MFTCKHAIGLSVSNFPKETYIEVLARNMISIYYKQYIYIPEEFKFLFRKASVSNIVKQWEWGNSAAFAFLIIAFYKLFKAIKGFNF